MVAFDNTKQKMPHTPPLRIETGGGVTIAGVSGQDFTVATKLRKVIGGFGMMDTDGMGAIATTGLVSNGQATFSRRGNIETSADTISYMLYGE